MPRSSRACESTLLFDQLIHDAPHLFGPWLHAAFILLFIGYGTKMGLAPMHNWKPDAYGEAPGVVGTLLAGGITSCAFLAILRVYQICRRRGRGRDARRVMIVMGLVSVAVAAVFMVRQRDFKRMLAYSSVEHMGILVLGIGIGGAAVYGALLHMINNGLTKGVLFLSAGNIHRSFGSKLTDQRARRDPPRAALRGAVPGRLSRHLRLAAVRALSQRVHDRQRGASAAASSWRPVCSWPSCSLSSSAWEAPCWPWSKAIRPSDDGSGGFRDSIGTGGPDPACSWRWC